MIWRFKFAILWVKALDLMSQGDNKSALEVLRKLQDIIHPKVSLKVLLAKCNVCIHLGRNLEANEILLEIESFRKNDGERKTENGKYIDAFVELMRLRADCYPREIVREHIAKTPHNVQFDKVSAHLLGNFPIR